MVLEKNQIDYNSIQVLCGLEQYHPIDEREFWLNHKEQQRLSKFTPIQNIVVSKDSIVDLLSCNDLSRSSQLLDVFRKIYSIYSDGKDFIVRAGNLDNGFMQNLKDTMLHKEKVLIHVP